jgi:hypothetical protein
MLEFKISDTRYVEAWCMKYVGPRLYYVHNRSGGEGWTIRRAGVQSTVIIQDDNHALMAMLKFGK